MPEAPVFEWNDESSSYLDIYGKARDIRKTYPTEIAFPSIYPSDPLTKPRSTFKRRKWWSNQGSDKR